MKAKRKNESECCSDTKEDEGRQEEEKKFFEEAPDQDKEMFHLKQEGLVRLKEETL
jgi:hypothetical protein